MKTNKFMRLMALTLLFVCMATVFSGCDDGLTDTQRLIKKWERNKATFDGEKIEFSTISYFDASFSSGYWPFYFKVDNEHIYIDDVLYECIYTEDFDIIYEDYVLVAAEGINKEKAEMLKKIQKKKECYLLERQDNGESYEKIAVYEIDDIFYLIDFKNNGSVRTVHLPYIKEEK